jgi:competence protein ComEC
MRSITAALALLLAACIGTAAEKPAPTLDIYYIDTEGGQSTLFVGPRGESLLVDTGNAGERDLARIADTLRGAGISRIDHLWTTHFHADHVGALLELAKQFPIGHFHDHGAPNPKDRIISAPFMASYAALSEGKRSIVKPGDKLVMGGLDITTVASASQSIRNSLKGGGRANATCASMQPVDESAYFDPDNGESAGFALAYGRFRTVDLGDLTWNGELALMCPVNRIGTVDVYLTSHHGLAKSGSPALVHGLQPRVAVMNNGTRKGGDANAFRVLHASPGLEDLWQLHWSWNAGLENAPAIFIANVDDTATVAGVLTQPPGPPGRGPAGPAGAGAPVPPGGPGGPPAFGAVAHSPAYLIKVSAHQDGSFTVTNTRNGFSKSYPPRR